MPAALRANGCLTSSGWMPSHQRRGRAALTGSTRGLKLICESEWTATESHILEDFFKLTFALADFRLFIYTNTEISSPIYGVIHPVELCKRACPLSRGFRYLALGFPERITGTFQIDSWIA